MKQKPKKLYFAYGSNMDQARLEKRVGRVDKIGVGQLEGYSLVFNAGGVTEGGRVGPFANLRKTGRSIDIAEGVIYALTDRQLRILDTYEGAPYHYNRVIERLHGKSIVVYIAINESYKMSIIPMQYKDQPSTDYLVHLVKGAMENKLYKLVENLNQRFPIQLREIGYNPDYKPNK